MNKIQQSTFSRPAGLAGVLALASRYLLMIAVLIGIFGAAAESQAQTVRFRGGLNRATVPLAYVGNYAFTNVATVSGLVNPVDFTISGLPSGVTYTIAATNGALPLNGGLPSTLITTNLLITLIFDGSEVQGVTTANLNGANGATNNWQFEIQVAKLWSGANYLAGVSTNLNDSGNWVGGSTPATGDDVVFGQSGATNATAITNIVVTASQSVASLRFAPTNSTFKFYTLLLQPGVTLATTGPQGFRIMKDTINQLTGNGGITVSLRGMGGTLSVSNSQANFISLVDNGQASLFDLVDLGNLNVDVKHFGWGDCDDLANFRNWTDQNGYGSQPRQFLNSINLARTNVIRATYADPNNYTNADDRHFSLSWLRSEVSGSTTAQSFNFGISNMFYVDSINLGGGNSRGSGQFNTLFNNSNAVAIFRGTNGGRLSVFAIADGAGTNNHQTSPNNTFNFLAGTLDIQADRLYIGRDRRLITAGQNPNYAGTLLMGKGTLDANTVVLGYREYEQTNATIHGLNSQGYCVGRITVSNGVARINKSLTLGYTVATTLLEENTGGNTDQGQFSVIFGANAYVNTINVGGPTYFSRNNLLYISNSASITISNYCGGSNQMLDNAVFANGSTLVGYLNATSTVAFMYATNYITTGSNTFLLAGIRNPGSLVNGQLIPLFKRAAGAAPSFTFINQSGINGSIVVDGGDPLLLNFQVILNSPKNLVWKGTFSSDWDNATKNWLDLTTSLQTNFAAGDNVTFDDTASQFNINLLSSAVILPGAAVMTNNLNAYTFNNSGGGSIIGTSTLAKHGTNNLQFDGSATASLTVNEGHLIGSGTVATVTVNSGATMNFSGIISGNLIVAGTAVSTGSVNGSLTVNSGGIATNTGSMNGSFVVNSGGLFVNDLGALLTSIVTSSVNAGGTMFNRGNITGINLNVGGTFKDSGEGITALTGTFTAASGATIIPGGDGVGITTIQSGGGGGFPGRVLLGAGSTNIFKFDIIGSANTKLLSGFQDFGGSTSVRSQDGGTLLLTNVTGSFAAGQSFTLFQYSGGGNPFPTGSSTNRYPIIVPANPGPGLAWDLTQLWPSGVIGVSTNVGPMFTNTFTVLGGSNIVGEFTWDPANYGWRLQSKTATLADGLSSSNPWTGIAGSWTNTTVILTNTLNTNTVFYRLTFP